MTVTKYNTTQRLRWEYAMNREGTWCIMESALPKILAVDKCMKKLIGLQLIFFLPSEGSLAPGFQFLGCFQDTAWFGSWSWREDMATAQSTSRYWFINGYVFESLICGELIWPFCFRVWSCRTRRTIQWRLGGWNEVFEGALSGLVSTRG